MAYISYLNDVNAVNENGEIVFMNADTVATQFNKKEVSYENKKKQKKIALEQALAYYDCCGVVLADGSLVVVPSEEFSEAKDDEKLAEVGIGMALPEEVAKKYMGAQVNLLVSDWRRILRVNAERHTVIKTESNLVVYCGLTLGELLAIPVVMAA